VLLLGETGTGKELIARMIHAQSPRSKGPFLRVNCGAVPPELIDSQLFGHERGAFTGAVEARPGWFERADGGTLLLDEVGELPLAAQVRLLRILQDGWMERVGGREPVHVDVRIVAATNRDLAGMVSQGQFREDLWYRIAVFPIRLPPLRERPEDIPDLVRAFFQRGAAEGLPLKAIEQAAMERMKRYPWPGNVRELENLTRRLAALYPQDVIGDALIEAELSAGSAPSIAPAPAPGEDLRQRAAAPVSIGGGDGFNSAMERAIGELFRSFGGANPQVGLYHRVLHDLEAPLIAATLGLTRGNQIKAAEILGLNRNTLRKKIRDLNLREMPTFR
jgi:two-component system nitrogen regulation response regulator GlnG